MGPPRWNGRPRRDGAGGLRPRGRRGGRPRRPTGLVCRSLRRARSGPARERQRGLPPSSHRRREARTAEARRVETFAPEELPPLGFDQGRSSETRSGVERKRSRQRLSGFRPFRGPADSPPQAFSHTNPPSFRIVHSSGSSPDRPAQPPIVPHSCRTDLGCSPPFASIPGRASRYTVGRTDVDPDCTPVRHAAPRRPVTGIATSRSRDRQYNRRPLRGRPSGRQVVPRGGFAPREM